MKAAIFSITCIFAGVASEAVRADENDDLLQQVVTQASKNQDAATAAQVQQFATEHKNVIEEIFQGYRAYLNQLSDPLSDDPASKQNRPALSLASQPDPAANLTTTSTSSTKSQTGLQIGHLEASGPLQGAHLPGYPALPDVPPTSSILNPTAEQLAHKARLDEETRQRKAFLQQHPNSSQ